MPRAWLPILTTPHYVEVAKAAKCAEIDAFRDSKLFAGIPYTGGPIVSEKLFEASRVKRTDLNSVIATGKDEQDALDDEGQGEIYIHPWWDIDENQYDFTIAEFKHFRRSLSQFVSPIYGAGKWHKAVVEHVDNGCRSRSVRLFRRVGLSNDRTTRRTS